MPALTMFNKLLAKDWHPFPAYQDLLKKLEIIGYITHLYDKLIQMQKGNNVDDNKSYSLQLISMLEAYAHTLNMIEDAFDSSSEKKSTSINTWKECGLISNTLTYTYDCHNNLKFIKDVSTTMNISLNITYIELIGFFNTFIKSSELRVFCVNLFENLDSFDEPTCKEVALKSNGNLFINGLILRIITISNEYKEGYGKLTKERASKNDAKEESPDLTCRPFNKVC